MDRIFRIRCSQIGKIMGRVGLTEIQEAKLKELSEREITNMPKPLTPAMVKELIMCFIIVNSWGLICYLM